jgi:hypothetical protein
VAGGYGSLRSQGRRKASVVRVSEATSGIHNSYYEDPPSPSSPRTRGPIRRGLSLGTLASAMKKTVAGGYGSLRSQGRRKASVVRVSEATSGIHNSYYEDPPSPSSPRTRGPIRRGLSLGTLTRRHGKNPGPVVMGPCFRRDDAKQIEPNARVRSRGARIARAMLELCDAKQNVGGAC